MQLFKQTTLIVSMAATALLGACSSTPIAKPVTVTKAPTSLAPVPPVQAVPQPTAPAVVVAVPPASYLDPKSPLYNERSIYFDFDQSIVKPDAAQLVELHGRYLAAHPEVSIQIQGNTDSQGGAEYNLALGQKRADAVLNALKIFGVKDTQLEAVSYGKEKPKVLGNDEAAYAQNRRADLAYPSK